MIDRCSLIPRPGVRRPVCGDGSASAPPRKMPSLGVSRCGRTPKPTDEGLTSRDDSVEPDDEPRVGPPGALSESVGALPVRIGLAGSPCALAASDDTRLGLLGGGAPAPAVRDAAVGGLP